MFKNMKNKFSRYKIIHEKQTQSKMYIFLPSILSIFVSAAEFFLLWLIWCWYFRSIDHSWSDESSWYCKARIQVSLSEARLRISVG